jgi:hypothetical protein
MPEDRAPLGEPGMPAAAVGALRVRFFPLNIELRLGHGERLMTQER